MNLESVAVGFLVGACFGGAIGLVVAVVAQVSNAAALRRERMRCRGWTAVCHEIHPRRQA